MKFVFWAWGLYLCWYDTHYFRSGPRHSLNSKPYEDKWLDIYDDLVGLDNRLGGILF